VRKLFYKVSSLLLILSPRRELNSGHDGLDFFIRYVHLYVPQFVHMYPLFWYVCNFFNLEFVWLLYIRNVTFEFE